MIDVTYTLTQSEYLEALGLYTKDCIKRGQIRRAIMLSVLFFLVFGYWWMTTDPRTAVLITAAAALASIGLGLSVRKILYTWVFKKRFKTDARLLTNMHLVADETGTHVDTPGVGHSTLEWPAFTTWFEGEQGFVLIMGRLFRAIPKRVLVAPEIVEFRTLLEQKIGAKGIARTFATPIR